MCGYYIWCSRALLQGKSALGPPSPSPLQPLQSIPLGRLHHQQQQQQQQQTAAATQPYNLTRVSRFSVLDTAQLC